MSDPVVSFRSIVALVDQFPVLSGVDLHIEKGEVVLIEGANGAGKTSLLRTIAGLLPPAQGQAYVLGFDLFHDSRLVRRQVGFLGHDSHLYGDLTVRENLDFFVRAGHADRAAIGPALERFGLDGRLASVAVDRLSAGQRRRVSLAVVVARNVALWLLDEPHTGLDHSSRQELDALVAEVSQRGTTVVFSSHESDVAASLAQRSVTISGGASPLQLDVNMGTLRNNSTNKVPTHVA